jgi:hypothetical protein
MSGLVSGIVYWKMLQRGSPGAVRTRARARARTIYFTYLGVVLYITAFLHGVRGLGIRFAPTGCGLLAHDPLTGLLLAPTFIYQPGFSNILPMYCLFMFLLPVALEQIRRGRETLLLAASVGLWWAAQRGAFRALLRPVVALFDLRIPFFDPLAWQILFVFGLWFGARRADDRPVGLPRSAAFMWALVLPLSISFLIRHEIFFDAGAADLLKRVTRRHDLDVLRLANFAALAYVVMRMSEWRRSWFEWRWLAFLGQHSLQVFAFSIAVSYAARIIGRSADPFGQYLTAAVAVASLTLPAWAHVRYREARARRSEAAAESWPA